MAKEDIEKAAFVSPDFANGGHHGVEKTTVKVSQIYWWKGLWK